jgi:hypothetical protein
LVFHRFKLKTGFRAKLQNYFTGAACSNSGSSVRFSANAANDQNQEAVELSPVRAMAG